MIITVVCDVLGKENNGTTVAAMNLIRHLKKYGHTVRVLCSDAGEEKDENYFIVPQISLGKILDGYVKKVGVTLSCPDEKIIKEALDGADLVHIMVPLALGLETIKIAREMNLPITAGFHMQAENLTSYFKLNKVKLANHLVYKFIYNHFYKYVDRIHFPTQFIRDTFEKNIKTTTKGEVISNGVHSYVAKREVEKPEELKDKITILSIGRLAREKSQDTLIKAVKLSKYKDKIQLVFAGQGPKDKYYKKLSKGLKNAPIFKLFARNDVIDAINYSDLYVHPAEIELEGIACLEAITCGKLTLASDSKLNATHDFVVDESCLFKNRNPKSLAERIDFWLDNPKLREEYEQKELEKAGNKYNQENCMKNMEKMMIEAVNEKEGRKNA